MQIGAEVSCKAAGPWGMVGMIEDTMATQVCKTRHQAVIRLSIRKHSTFPMIHNGFNSRLWSCCTTLQAQDSIDSFLAFAVSWCESAAAASQVTLSPHSRTFLFIAAQPQLGHCIRSGRCIQALHLFGAGA